MKKYLPLLGGLILTLLFIFTSYNVTMGILTSSNKTKTEDNYEVPVNDSKNKEKNTQDSSSKTSQPKDSERTEHSKNPEKELNYQIYDNYDNTLYGWGFVRNDQHLPPDAGNAGKIIKKYNAMYIGNTKEKTIYLTFDLGYENGYTGQILDVLKANDVKAHFFITASTLKDQPELIKRMIKEGHVVGNHSVNHYSLPTLETEKAAAEIQGFQDQLNEIINYQTYLFRPPRGEWSERTLKITGDLGYKTVFWSMAYKDWLVDEQKGWQRAYNHVMSNVHNGAVILLHAVSSDNANALDYIIKDLKKEGYNFGIIKK